MTKFQMKLTRFACFMVKERDWTPLINLLLVAMFLSLGLAFLFGSSICSTITVVVGIIALASRLIYDWAYKRFLVCFALTPSTNEKNILELLRKLALWLGEEFEESDEMTDLSARTERVKFAKNRFWSMWRLAKAMGFPVFKSWRTHAQIIFVEW